MHSWFMLKRPITCKIAQEVSGEQRVWTILMYSQRKWIDKMPWQSCSPNERRIKALPPGGDPPITLTSRDSRLKLNLTLSVLNEAGGDPLSTLTAKAAPINLNASKVEKGRAAQVAKCWRNISDHYTIDSLRSYDASIDRRALQMDSAYAGGYMYLVCVRYVRSLK